ncbi:MAG: hypothetical protein AAFY48_08980 [Bacteroidota bacterium]
MLEIGELNIQLPGYSPNAAEEIVRQVIQRLSALVPAESQTIELDNLNLRLEITDTLSQPQLVERIAQQIWQQIQTKI